MFKMHSVPGAQQLPIKRYESGGGVVVMVVGEGRGADFF